MKRTMDWQSERETAIQAARQAGQLLLDWSGRFSVRKKGHNDLVTEADLAAQTLIAQVLGRRFPADAFLGEEDAGKTAHVGPGRRWIVDPLDGTMNFVHGFPFYCVSIGLEVAGTLVLGVVYDPVRKECFSAAAGAGAHCNGVTLQVSPTADLAEALVGIGLPTQVTEDSPAIRQFGRLSDRVRGLRRMGSAALSLAYVAAGRLDAFLASDIRSWDAAGGAVLVREAGGNVTDFAATPYSAATPSIVATNGLIHRPLQAAAGTNS